MSEIYNENVVFRCPSTLKQRMKAFAEANDLHLSAFIRGACSDVLRRESPSFYPAPSSANSNWKSIKEAKR